MQGITINGQPNPLLQAYDNAPQSAAVLAAKLLNMLGEKPLKKQKADADAEEVEGKKMPDFEMCSPSQLRRWCKEFDIDPNDYSKQYLVKALIKRWKFKYED